MAKSSNPTKNEISYADVRFRIYPLSIHCKNAIPKGSSYSIEIEKGIWFYINRKENFKIIPAYT